MPVGGRPVLRRVLDEASGPPSTRIDRALGLLLEQLGMDVAFVGEFDGGARVVTHTMSAPGVGPVPVGLSHPVQETLCHLFITGGVDPIVADATAHPQLAHHPHTALFGIGAYAGVPLLADGTVIGALCCAASAPVQVVERDIAALRTVAEYISALLGPTPGIRAHHRGSQRRVSSAMRSTGWLEPWLMAGPSRT